MKVSEILMFLLPIFVGSVIGLFTNWLAIKMLFRPLKEIRLWGIKIPFTPGILPRERKRIAESLGKTVALDLLNEESLMERLCAPDFVSGLEKALVQAFSALSAFDGSSLGQGLDSEIGKHLRELAARAGKSIVSQPVFRAALEKSLAGSIELLEINEFGGFLESLAAAIYPAASKALLELLGKNPLRSRIEKITAGLLKKALQRFNSFQRFFISLGQYDRAIIENVPATVDDFLFQLARTLETPENRDAIIKAFAGLAKEQKLGDVFALFPELMKEAPRMLTKWLESLVTGTSRKDSAVSKIAGQFARELGEGFSAMTIGQIIGFGDEEARRLAALVAPALARLAARESAAILSSLDVKKMVEKKINSLDMIEVERMLLRIIERELNAITWFGALLGAIIGLGQSLLGLLQ